MDLKAFLSPVLFVELKIHCRQNYFSAFFDINLFYQLFFQYKDFHSQTLPQSISQQHQRLCFLKKLLLQTFFLFLFFKNKQKTTKKSMWPFECRLNIFSSTRIVMYEEMRKKNQDFGLRLAIEDFKLEKCSRIKRIGVKQMDNLLSFTVNEYDTYMFCAPEEQERKVHTPYVEPQHLSFENSSSIMPINSKIQFTLTDIAIAKKAKSRKTKTTEDPNSNKKSGHWSSDENKRYHWFLELHHQHFFNKHLRRTDRIFKSMATFVETREAEQCRSHHQKMEKKYKYFSKILMSLRLQNYNSDDSDLILTDMCDKGHDITQVHILSALQLKNFSETSFQSQKQNESQPRTPKPKLLKQQITSITIPSSLSHFQQVVHEEHKQPEQEIFGNLQNNNDYIDNIFDDTYERNIGFGGFF